MAIRALIVKAAVLRKKTDAYKVVLEILRLYMLQDCLQVRKKIMRECPGLF